MHIEQVEIQFAKKEEIKRNSVIKQTKIINFDNVAKENIKIHNESLPKIPDHLYRLSIIGVFR